MRRALVVTAVLTLGLASACDSPSRGFERFYDGLAAQDAARVRDSISAQSRALGDVDHLVKKPPATSVRAIRVVEETSERAVLEVEDVLGAKERVAMIREDGRWRVDLAAPAPTPAP